MKTFMEFIESYKIEDQTFSDDKGEYSVSRIVRYAEKNKEVLSLPIDSLLHNLEPSPYETGSELPGDPEFIARANEADLKYPIIVVRYDDGDFIADGVHRLWRAKSEGREEIRAYVFDREELDQFRMDR